MEVNVFQDKNKIDISIGEYSNKPRQLLCIIMAVSLLVIGLIGFFYSIYDGNILVAFIILILFTYLSYGYLDGFFWNKQGVEKLYIEGKKGYFFKKGLGKFFAKEFTIDNFTLIKEYDSSIDGIDPAPRSDGYINAYGGKIIVKYQNTFFRFGKNLSNDDIQYIIKSVTEYIKSQL